MYNVNDILARLQNGESADAIAQSFADVLNQAIAAKSVEEEKTKVRAAKVADLTDIIDLILNFINQYYPDLVSEVDVEVTAEDIESLVDELDNTIAQAKIVTNLMAHPARKNVTITTDPSPTMSKKINNCNDSIMNFLKINGLL
jgi:uncharacterized protein (DUF1778 family)